LSRCHLFLLPAGTEWTPEAPGRSAARRQPMLRWRGTSRECRRPAACSGAGKCRVVERALPTSNTRQLDVDVFSNLPTKLDCLPPDLDVPHCITLPRPHLEFGANGHACRPTNRDPELARWRTIRGYPAHRLQRVDVQGNRVKQRDGGATPGKSVDLVADVRVTRPFRDTVSRTTDQRV